MRSLAHFHSTENSEEPAIVVLSWAYSPVATLLILTGLYGAAGVWLGRTLRGRLRDWQTLPAPLDQLRKDRACLEKLLA